MGKVIDEFQIGQYKVLKLDEIPKKSYHKFRVDGIEMMPVPAYDMQQCIAVQSSQSFLGKDIEFI
jgi:hypothetical protein